MSTQQEVIKKFMKSLDKTTKKPAQALDAAVKACSKFKSVQAVFDQMISDRKKSANAEDFLQRYCGIFLDNLDTGAITGSDAGGTKIKSATNILPGKAFDTSFEKTSFVKSGVTFQLVCQDNKKISYPSNPYLPSDCRSLSAEELHVWQALYSSWAEESLKLIKQSYGYSLTDSDSQFKKIRILFVNDSSSSKYTAKAFDKIYDDPDGKYVYVGINMYYFNNIDKNSLEGKYPAWDDYYLNRLIAHELTHVVMNAKIDSFSTMPALILEGTAELTGGMDDSQDINIKKAVATQSMLEKLLVLNENYNQVDGVNNPDYVAGYIFLRYLAKQASTRGEDLYASNEKQSLAGGAYEDTLAASADKVTIRGNASNDSLSNNGASSVKILGGDGADQIFSYGNKVTLDGGKNDDYFYLYSDASNALVKGGSGNDEIHSAAKKATIDAGTGNDYVQLFNNATKTTLDAGAGNDTIYSGAQTASIFGGDGKDFIDLYSAATKTTVNGGTGNDSIVSYSTSGVVYEYQSGDGKDTIKGITDKDTLLLSGKNFSSKTSGKNILLTVDDQNIKLVEGKGVAYKVSIAGTVDGDTVNNSVAGASINLLDGDNRVFNEGKKASIVTGAGIDSIFNHAASVTLNGGKNDDYIYNASVASSSSIVAGAGNDSIFNHGQKVTIEGGSGKDYIGNFESNVLIKSGSGNDSIFGNDGSKITIDAGEGHDRIALWSTNNSVFGGAGNDTIWGDAGKDTLYGGADNDRLYGDAGADKLNGGAGNDSLWGGAGNDTFIYTANEGTDRIFDYATGDMLKILNADGSDGSFKSYKYSGGDLTLTINGGGKIIFKDVSANTTFNINGTSYKISGSKLK